MTTAWVIPLCYRRGQRLCHMLLPCGFSPHMSHPMQATCKQNSTALAPFSPSLLDWRNNWKFVLEFRISEHFLWILPVCSVLQFPLSCVLLVLVITLTHFSYLFGPLLSEQTISHHLWHICWLILTFVHHFTFWTLCPDYITHPKFLYKYWTQLPVHTTCSYLLISNKQHPYLDHKLSELL